MNDLTSNTTVPAGAPQAGDEGLKQLKMLVHACAISLLILICTFFIYLFRQTGTVRNSIEELAAYIDQYEQSNAPQMITELHIRLDEFRRQHPDFSPIYTRYFGTNPPPLHAGRQAPSPEKVVPAPAQPPQ
jgi:hypothetical protein